MPETLFTPEDQQGTPTETEAQDNYLQTIVTAKGDSWSDPNVLAKGYLSAQQHIEQIEAENAKLREQATKQDYMKEVLERIGTGKATPAGGEPEPNNTSAKQTENQGWDAEKIKSLVSETLTEQEAARTADENVKETKRLLTERFGTEAGSKMQEAMASHSMSKERMDQLAAESPSAFMALLGAPTKKESNATPNPAVNTTSDLSKGGKKDWAYWQKLRREHPSLYRTSATQNEMALARESMSKDEFYGSL